MMKTFYLDHAATTKLNEVVLKDMMPYLSGSYGNPSSLHSLGIQNKKAINDAKKQIAKILNCRHDELIFTASGTEATNLAIKGYALKHKDKKEIITTKIEHAATLNTVMYLASEGYIVHYLDVDHQGFIQLSDLEKLMSSNTLLVSIIWGNNEIGVIQDIHKIAQIVHQKGSILHVDAVQMLAHDLIDLEALNIDMMSFSAHKIEGPKGIGMLYKKSSIELIPLIHGGGHEFGLRSGTENVANIVGFSKALSLLSENSDQKRKQLNLIATQFLEALKQEIPFILNGPVIGKDRIPGLLSLSFKGISGLSFQFKLNQLGIYVSTGSACHSNEIGVSHVISAIKCTNPNGVIRISFGLDFDLGNLPYIILCFKQVYNQLIEA